MTDSWMPLHLGQELELDRYGGPDRVRASLDPDEEIEYASHGWIEEMSQAPGTKKQQEGLLLITNRRVLVVRSPRVLRKNPSTVSIPFDTIFNAGPHKSFPHIIVVACDTKQIIGGHYLVLPSGEASDMTAIIWGTTILEAAEAAGGTANAP